jgi:hypothetical protein
MGRPLDWECLARPSFLGCTDWAFQRNQRMWSTVAGSTRVALFPRLGHRSRSLELKCSNVGPSSEAGLTCSKEAVDNHQTNTGDGIVFACILYVHPPFRRSSIGVVGDCYIKKRVALARPQQIHLSLRRSRRPQWHADCYLPCNWVCR